MTEEKLNNAANARLSGDNATAIRLCREILSAAPDNLDAISLLGVSLIEVGDLTQGSKLVQHAAQQSPQNWRYLLNLSVLAEVTGDDANAIEIAKRASAAGPDRFEAWGRLGSLLGKVGDFKACADALKRAHAIEPGHEGVALQLAAASLEIEDLETAGATLDRLGEPPHLADGVLRLKTRLARRLANWTGLVALAQRWISIAPHEDEARIAMAYGLSQQGFYARAAEAYEPVLAKHPNNAEHLAAVGRLHLGARDMDKAHRYFQRALEADPQCAEAAFGVSRYLTFYGRMDEAETYVRRALAADPRHAEAHAQLAEITKSPLTDTEINALAALGADESLSAEHRAIVYFALGDARHRRKEREAAFAAWSAANEQKMRHREFDFEAIYDEAARERETHDITTMFDGARRETSNDIATSDTPTPIFIVGMPRSGTTLLESALSAHPMAAGGGELPALPIIRREFMEWAKRAGWRGGGIPDDVATPLREKYFRQYIDFKIPQADFITDKLPPNFWSVGLISVLFPEAKIIHIRRSPLETGFSIFRRNFSRHWTFATSLEAIGHYYGQYARIMTHWEKTYPGLVTFIQHEDLVANFEDRLRELVAFCGLPWDDQCLHYYEADRAVITFSATQVRKPPSPDHLNSTAPYQALLAPLAARLEKENVDLATGALKSL